MRYAGSGSVFPKRTTLPPPFAGVSEAIGVFETALVPAGIVSVSSQGDLNDGSSKQGNARRASVVSSCV